MGRLNRTLLMALPTQDPHKALTVFASFDDGLSWPWSQFVDPDDCYHPSLTTFPDDPEHVGCVGKQCKGCWQLHRILCGTLCACQGSAANKCCSLQEGPGLTSRRSEYEAL